MIIVDDITELPVTDGTIALLNLRAQIDGLEPDVRLGRATIASRVDLIELITLRGLILGHIADYERAEEFAQQLVCDGPLTERPFSHVPDPGRLPSVYGCFRRRRSCRATLARCRNDQSRACRHLPGPRSLR